MTERTKCVRLVSHKVFTPTPGDPIDFENTIEEPLREWNDVSGCVRFGSIRTRWSQRRSGAHLLTG